MNQKDSIINSRQSVSPYHRVLESFSAEELGHIIQLKRLFEWAEGDPEFGKHLDAGKPSPQELQRLKAVGISFDTNEVAQFRGNTDIIKQFSENFSRRQQIFSQRSAEKLKHYPLLELWLRFVERRIMLRRKFSETIFRLPKHPKFDAWRMRRITAVRSELGFYGRQIDHPILAFELGDGCSIGCWFCAFAARKLTKNFDYPENREFFREIIRHCVNLFGREQTGGSLLYYGTEPHDNPHYLEFLKDFTGITGYPLATSTAVTTDVEWGRKLIAFYRQGPYPWPRFSVLSKAMLFKIHDLYSPEELRDVELLMQMKEHPRPKISGGRILKEESGMRSRGEGHYLDGIVPQGTIACVTGFLINMVKRTIQLVSPCYTSKKWPYGYRVFDETTFTDARGFQGAITTLIGRSIPEEPPSILPIRFRDDLAFRPTEKGFDLVSPHQVYHFRGKDSYKPLGELIAEGKYTCDELYAWSTKRDERYAEI